MTDRINAFVTDYVNLCNKHGLMLTYDGGITPGELADLNRQDNVLVVLPPSDDESIFFEPGDWQVCERATHESHPEVGNRIGLEAKDDSDAR